MFRNSLVSRVAALAGLLLLPGCSKEIDFSVPASFTVNSEGGVPYSTVQGVDLSVDAPDAWSHKDKVKDLSLVDVDGTIVAIFSSPTGNTGSGTVSLRPDGATSSASDVLIGTYANEPIVNGRTLTITLSAAAIDIINNALQGNGRFQVVAAGSTTQSASFEVEFTLQMKLNYKII
jgi:hypothetical protein